MPDPQPTGPTSSRGRATGMSEPPHAHTGYYGYRHWWDSSSRWRCSCGSQGEGEYEDWLAHLEEAGVRPLSNRSPFRRLP